MKKALDEVHQQYTAICQTAEAFAEELNRQFNGLLSKNNVALAVPVQWRVKEWSSIAEKAERRELPVEDILNVSDLIGLRLILLFHRDVKTVCGIIRENFNVLEHEDTQARLGESQFGYSSIHFLVKVPESWLRVPTLAGFQGLRAEIQVRTVAQHLWAAGSHILQYKKEESVAPQIRRAIYRLSALLESADLEFERILTAREQHNEQIDVASKEDTLDVDSLDKVLISVFPNRKRSDRDDYSELLEEIKLFGVTTPAHLRALLIKHEKAVVKDDSMRAQQTKRRKHYFTNTGLVRMMMTFEFSSRWDQFLRAKIGLGVPKVSQIDLPAPLQKILSAANVETVFDLAVQTRESLQMKHGVSQDSLNTIEERLKKLSLGLGMNRSAAALSFTCSGKSPARK